MKRVAIYVRGESRDTQEAQCRKWAEENGYTVALVRHDVAVGQPSLHQLIAEIPKGKFDTILAAGVKEYSRNIRLTEKLVRTARAAGVKVLTADNRDLTSVETLFMTQVEMLHHHYQLDKEQAELRALAAHGMRRVVAELTDAEIDALRGYVDNISPTATSGLKKLLEGVQDPEESGCE